MRLSTSPGMPSTFTSRAGMSPETSTTRTLFWASREDKRGLRHGNGAEKRFEVKPIADLGCRLEAIGQAESSPILRRHEHRQAVGLIRPEVFVIHEVKQCLLDGSYLSLIMVVELARASPVRFLGAMRSA